ncbi:MAG: energy transducer TonB [Burkholderiaceae bacterium]
MRFTAVLQPGCLLPAPALLRTSPLSRAVLALQVDASGRVASASVRDSAGNGELDAALQAAAMRCRFAPAYVVDGATRARTEVPDDYLLNVHWPAQGALMGAARCMTPDYPHAARRVEEMGEVLVRFRKSPTTGQPEAEVSKSPAGLRILQPLSLRAVSDCLAHEEVAADLPSDRWYVAAYHWRLD